MSLKKKLGLGVASAALGLSLIGGGTYAYFSDTAVTNNTFSAGTLKLLSTPTEIINVSDIKPGDWMPREFTLKNDGTLDISKVLLHTEYEAYDAQGNRIDDFAEHIRVDFLYNKDKALLEELSPDQVVYRTTLANLAKTQPDVVSNKVFVPRLEEKGGLKPGNTDKLYVQFKFVDNGDQNKYQGATLKLKWTFEAHQTSGVKK
ncbi:TasA family protein [Bacillus sp. CHD6a]|uniref:TasA family protein n=1 Tax=Bacillus sp. CHD6a TaxID=1643452 RepID=UPI0006CD658B|nr:TasA family protein [Bacillus sp. CHD6a]KPB04642.1 cell division protein FtsN [Bacillus sp. CHD6a]